MADGFLFDFIERAQAGDSRLGRALKSRTAAVLERCVDGFQRNNDLLWASALTYTTGLSIVPILAIRIEDEEKMLRQELDGYDEYTQKVQYRLVPGVW